MFEQSVDSTIKLLYRSHRDVLSAKIVGDVDMTTMLKGIIFISELDVWQNDTCITEIF